VNHTNLDKVLRAFGHQPFVVGVGITRIGAGDEVKLNIEMTAARDLR
jgi:hypothetical protein